MTRQLSLVLGSLGGQSLQMVDARLLYDFLGIRRDFSNWIKGRIAEYGFEAGTDFVRLDSPDWANQAGHGGNRRRQQYLLTLDMAKELAMVERTPLGREARRYFIACEQQLRSRSTVPTPGWTFSPEIARRINQEAWARASSEIYAAFDAHRRALLAKYRSRETTLFQTSQRPQRPWWAW